ncbi:protein SCAR2 [Apium graveolens]|uniref:protein SCAR2 n=1 Tax=Apium graveolens TaxID=4045 RepID=UPI003D792A95
MPMSRYEIRNEYSLADPELYGAADDNDPEALLEAVSMAGLVGLLRQLGDLAEFAAEIFHDLHEEVMATATRGHGLIVRVKQLEAEVPLIEKACLSQTSPSVFFSNAGTNWHPSLQTNQNLITGGDLPRFIMDSYEECRGPPRLFLLDKFDVAGAGACLKRYTDPSFFKVEPSSYGLSSAEVHKEKRSRKSKKKSSRWRNVGTPEVLPASHAKLQHLLLEDRVEDAITDPARLVKLKRGLNKYPFGSVTGKSFMDKFINASLPEDKVVHEIAYGSSPLELPLKTTSEADSAASFLRESTSDGRSLVKPFSNEVGEGLGDMEFSSGTREYSLQIEDEKEIAINGESRKDVNENGYQSDDVASEVDKYMDALATMETEIETDTEYRTKNDIGLVDREKQGTDFDVNDDLIQSQFSDSQSARNSSASEDRNDSVKKGSSSFSYSDTGSTGSKNMPVDVDVVAKESKSTKVCESDSVVMAEEKVSSSEELSVSEAYQPPKGDVSDYTSNVVPGIPSYESESGEPCSSLRHSDSSSTHIPLEEGKSLARGTLRGPQMVEIWSNHDEFDTRTIKTEENSRTRGNNIPWISRHSSITSQTKVDEPPVEIAPAEDHIPEKFNDSSGDLSIASVNISENIHEVIPKKYGDENSLDNLLAAEHEQDSCVEKLEDTQISLPHTAISQAEVEPSVPSSLDSETSYTVLQPDAIDSVDNAFPSAKEITFDSKLQSDSFSNSSTEEQQRAECTDIPPITIGLDVDTYHEEEKISDRVLPKMDSGEIGIITCSTGLMESETTAVNKNSSYMDSESPRSFTSVPVPSKEHDVEVGEISSNLNLIGSETIGLAISLGSLNTTAPESLIDEKQTENDQTENIIVEGIVANHDSDAEKVDSTHDKNLTAEEFPCVQSPDQYGFEICEEFFPQTESDKQTAMVNQEIVSNSELDSVQCETAFSDHSETEMFSYVPESSLQPVEAHALSSSSTYSLQHTEPVSSVYSELHEHSGESLLSTHHYPEAKTDSEPKLTLQTDQIDLEHLQLDETNPRGTQSEQPRCLDHIDEGSVEENSEPCVVESTPVIQVNMQADSFGMESLSDDVANYRLSSKLPLHNMDRGENVITSPDSSLIPSSTEAIKSEILPDSHGVGSSAHASDESTEICSGYPLIPAVPQIDLAEMPPLPPLPPVQWRIGRTQQNAFLPSDRDSSQNTFGMFPPMFPLKTSNDTQKGSPVSTDDMLSPVPVLQPPAVKDENHQHLSQNLLENAAQSDQLSMQMPLISNDGSRNIPTSDRTSNMDLCVTVSSTVNENSDHEMRAGEAGITQSSFFSSSPTETTVDASCFSGSVPSYPISQMQSEICLEPESTSLRSEIRLIKFPDTHVAQSTLADEHLNNDSTTSQGEAVSSTSNSLYPDLEDRTLNEKRPMKLQRPRTPLIDAVAAHDRSMLKKVKERPRPEVPKGEDRDSLLQQIRTKSFNLKPAVVTRPSIQAPKTNLRFAAILEKANAIRQALADSDEDDEDSWSDS